MADFDVFNGDADGLCALVQLRLAEPRASQLVTGVKRDIELLARVNASAGDRVTVLDISMRNNGDELRRVLAAGAEVFYVDHHNPGEIPEAENLTAHIDTAPDICTSLLVNNYLKGRYRLWAITAAFGDNMAASALKEAEKEALNETQLEQLRELGTCLNYNGYGSSPQDLHFTPETLYSHLSNYSSPLDFMEQQAAVYTQLRDGYYADLQLAAQAEVIAERASGKILLLPDETWARRVSGVYANQLASGHPDRAHAIVTHNINGGYTVSVRAPLNNTSGADTLCLQFSTGGGRKGAAGINHLPTDQIDTFSSAFFAQYS